MLGHRDHYNRSNPLQESLLTKQYYDMEYSGCLFFVAHRWICE